MNANELFDAIGQAEAGFVAHSERHVTRSSRAVARIGLIAAVLVVAMSITVAASPAVREWLFGVHELHEAQIARPVAVEVEDFAVFGEGKLEIRPEVDLQEGYPRRIKTFHVPMYLAENWTPACIYAEDPAAYLAYLAEECAIAWDNPDTDPPQGVFFHQYTGGYLDLGTPLTYIDIGYRQEDQGYTIEAVELAGIPMQRVRVAPSSVRLEHGFASTGGADYYFWTDGSYIFSISVPPEMEQSLLETIVQSVEPVDDIMPYLNFQDDVAVVEYPPLERHYVPGYVPEGWSLLDTLDDAEHGCQSMLWTGKQKSTLSLLHTSEEDADVFREVSWQSGMESYHRSSVAVNGVWATVYESPVRVQLVLAVEDGFVILESEGDGRVSVEELVKIAEELQPQT